MPASVLRPYSGAADGVYVPQLLNARYASWIPLSNQLYLVHPLTVSLLVVTASATLYYLNHVFESNLAFESEKFAGLEQATWKDAFAKGIYAMPPLAAIVGVTFAVAHWYHKRLWNRYSSLHLRKADIVDVPAYYSGIEGSDKTKAATSQFWCLEYEHEIVAAWGVDGRNPGRPLQTIEEERIPKEPESANETAVLPDGSSGHDMQKITDAPSKPLPAKERDDDEDDDFDLALFRHSSTKTRDVKLSQNTATPLTALAKLEDIKQSKPILEVADLAAAGPSYLPSSIAEKDTATLAELRHLTISDTYKSTKGVEGHIFALAVQSAFTTSERIERVILRLDPKLEKPFRTQALSVGFKVVSNDLKLDDIPEEQGFKAVCEEILRRVWPLSFDREILMLDRKTWQKSQQQ